MLHGVTSKRGDLQCSYVPSDRNSAASNGVTLTLTTDIGESSIVYPCCVQGAVYGHVFALAIGPPSQSKRIATTYSWLLAAAKRATLPD
jgi:hypothetical protein